MAETPIPNSVVIVSGGVNVSDQKAAAVVLRTPVTKVVRVASVAGAAGVTDHTLLTNIGINPHTAIDTHLADGTVHFLESAIDHINILNIGTNSHAAIDTHIADGTIHFGDAPADGETYGRNNNAWATVSAGGAGLISGTWEFDSGTATAPPDGQFRYDDAVYASVAEIFINDETGPGFDATNFLSTLSPGDRIYIQNAQTSGQFAVWDVNAAVTDEGDWFRIPVDLVEEGDVITDAADCAITILYGGGVGGLSHFDLTDIGTNTHASIDTHIADGTLHFLEGSIDHTAILNIGTNSHAAIDTHIADGTVHFLEGAIDHTNILNIGTNSHAAIDTHIADGTLHFTEGSIDHGSIAGLADDDHPGHLWGLGRPGGQTQFGGTLAGQTLTLQGSSAANRGRVLVNGGMTVDWDWTSDAIGTSGIRWAPTIPVSGGGILSFLDIQSDITVTASTFILSAVDDHSILEWTTAPGFAVSTLFFARPTYRSTTAGIPPAQAFIYAAQAQYEVTGTGAVTVPNYRGLSFAPIIRTNAGGSLTITNVNAVTVSPLWNTSPGTTANFGTIRGVHCLNPQAVLFGSSAGVETALNYIGLDMNSITIPVSGVRAAVRSSLVNNASNRVILNLGGADSDFGSGDAHFNDNVGVTFGNTVAAPDVQIGWDSANGSLNFNPAVGEDMEFNFAVFSGRPTYTFEAENFGASETNYTQILFGFDRYVFGDVGVIGNQIGLFLAPNRTVDVAGGWSDYLLTQSGNLNIGTFAMSDVAAWTLNSVSLDNTAGSITNLDTFVVGGMTTSNPGITVTARSAARIRGRLKQEGSVQYPPIAPSALSSGDNDDWAGLLTGSPNNNGRYWARVTGNVTTSVITGIDATAVQDGDTFELTNIGTETILLSNQDTGSTAANRIITGEENSFVLGDDDTVKIRYDSTTSRWRILTPPGAVAPLATVYKYDDTTTMADPTNGFFRTNNGTIGSVTAMALSAESFKGGDVSNIIGALASGDRMYIQRKKSGAEYVVFNVTSVVDNTTWFQINGTVNDSGDDFTDNQEFNTVAIFV